MRSLFLALLLAGCAHNPPNPNGPTPPAAFGEYFGQCMRQRGVQVVAGDIPSLWNIFLGGDIVHGLENFGIITAGGGISDAAQCAVQAFLQLNPLAPNVQPTKQQAACRVFQARHAKPAPGAEVH